MTGYIYIIINNVNSKFHIGSTSNLKTRFSKHIYDLDANRHHNKHLQNAWNKYGSDSFKFMKLFKSLDIKKDEQNLLDLIDYSCAYNISRTATGGDMIKNHPNKDEIYKKMSETKRRIGRKPNNRKKISINGDIYDSYHDAHKALGVPVPTIRHRCLSGNLKFSDWILLGHKKPKSYNIGDDRGIKIRCLGVDYPSYTSASKALNVSITCIQHRADSKNYPEFYRL